MTNIYVVHANVIEGLKITKLKFIEQKNKFVGNFLSLSPPDVGISYYSVAIVQSLGIFLCLVLVLL